MLEIIKKFYPNEQLHSYFTYKLGFLIYALIMNSDIKSYLEIGSGFGAMMVFAGMAFKDKGLKDEYQLYGIEHRSRRIKYAERLLENYGLKAKFLNADMFTIDWTEKVDAIFIDGGHRNNQLLIDKFKNYVNNTYFIHDVTDRLKFPDGFDAVYFPGRVIAQRFVQPKPHKYDKKV